MSTVPILERPLGEATGNKQTHITRPSCLDSSCLSFSSSDIRCVWTSFQMIPVLSLWLTYSAQWSQPSSLPTVTQTYRAETSHSPPPLPTNPPICPRNVWAYWKLFYATKFGLICSCICTNWKRWLEKHKDGKDFPRWKLDTFKDGKEFWEHLVKAAYFTDDTIISESQNNWPII